MGQAIARALVKNKSLAKIFISDRRPFKLSEGIRPDRAFNNLASAGFVMLAVKPQDLAVLAEEIKGKLNPKSLLVSIAAGVTIKKLRKLFAVKKMVRVMPNLGLSVGQGIAGWTSAGLNNIEKQKVKNFLSLFTENFEVKKESDIDAVTAISGSGPAYFFYLAQALQNAAVNLGFPPTLARKLVKKTLLAAGTLQRGKNYQELIKQVASKKGTTEAALKVLNKNHIDQIINQAVKAAQKRAKELSNAQ